MKYILIVMFWAHQGGDIEIVEFNSLAECQAVGQAAVSGQNWTHGRHRFNIRHVAKFKCVAVGDAS